MVKMFSECSREVQSYKVVYQLDNYFADLYKSIDTELMKR